MGFLDRLLPKKPSERKMGGDEVQGFLEKEISRIWETQDNFDPERAEAISKKIISANKGLEKAPESNQKVHKVLAGVSRSARKMVVSATERAMESIDFSSPKKFYASAGKALESISMNNSKYGERAKILFPKEYSQLWERLRELYDYYKEVEDVAKEKIEREKRLSGWLETIKEREETLKQMEILEGQGEKLKGSITEMESKLAGLEGELSRTRKSRGFEEYEEQMGSLDRMRGELAAVKSEFSALVLGVKKALLYYQHKIANSRMKEAVGEMMGEGGNFMDRKDSLEKAVSIFSEVRRGMRSRGIVIEDKRREKITRLMEKAGSEYLESLFKKHKEIAGSIREKRGEMESLPALKKMGSIEKEMEATKIGIRRMKKELEELERRAQGTRERLQEQDKKISTMKKGLLKHESIIVE